MAQCTAGRAGCTCQLKLSLYEAYVGFSPSSITYCRTSHDKSNYAVYKPMIYNWEPPLRGGSHHGDVNSLTETWSLIGTKVIIPVYRQALDSILILVRNSRED